VRRRRGIEVKCCLDDGHYAASFGCIWDFGSQVQQFRYDNSQINLKTLCVVWGFWMTCAVICWHSTVLHLQRLYSSSLFKCTVLCWRQESPVHNVETYDTAQQATDDNTHVMGGACALHAA